MAGLLGPALKESELKRRAMNSAMLNQSLAPSTGYACEKTANPYNPTLRERLISQKADLTQRLANVNAAIEALDNNPNFEEVLNVIGKVGY